MNRRLTFPAPKRETYNTPDDWASRRWTEQGVRDVILAGGWFVKGRHHFESRAVAKLAGVNRSFAK